LEVGRWTLNVRSGKWGCGAPPPSCGG
jgi:hypothetical protein